MVKDVTIPGSDTERVVRGEIALPTLPVNLAQVQALIQVEDVSRADAKSIVVGESRIEGLVLQSGALVDFVVRVPAHLVNDSHLYSVRVHVDVTGSGEVERGDLVSTRVHPVLSRGAGEYARVPVRVV